MTSKFTFWTHPMLWLRVWWDLALIRFDDKVEELLREVRGR